MKNLNDCLTIFLMIHKISLKIRDKPARLNLIHFSLIRVEPAQLEFLKRAKIAQKSPP